MGRFRSSGPKIWLFKTKILTVPLILQFVILQKDTLCLIQGPKSKELLCSKLYELPGLPSYFLIFLMDCSNQTIYCCEPLWNQIDFELYFIGEISLSWVLMKAITWINTISWPSVKSELTDLKACFARNGHHTLDSCRQACAKRSASLLH